MSRSLPRYVLHGVGFLIFGLFAWVQHNDTDPAVYDRPSVVDAWLWLLFYGWIAALCLLALVGPLRKWLLVVAVLACLVGLGRTLPGLWENLFGDRPFTMTQTSMSSSDPRVELTREFFGALIALGAVALLWWESRKAESGSRNPEVS